MGIIIKNLNKSFGDKKVLSNLNATFAEGKITCIMGASGCGKTTLLRILMGLEKFDSGEITGIPEMRSAVFQEDRLCESFSAFKNVQMCADKKYTKADIEENLSAIGLSECIYDPVSSFSGGMKRRVAIVRAIMAKSDIIFLDEAFKGLDEELKGKTIAYVCKAAYGKTIISVTHSPEETRMMDADVFEM